MKFNCCKKDPEGNETTQIAEVLKVLAEENRLKIVCILKKGEHCACKIVKHLDLPQNLVSHHLNKLKEAGLITGRKEGIWIHYSLTEVGKKIAGNIFEILK
jgi:ArsR family transcriptional regulator